MASVQAFAAGNGARAWAPPTDESSWIAEAYEAYAHELEVYVARSFGGRVTPEDVVHEAFARLVRDVAAGRAPLRVRPWLYRVAHNLAVDELRRPIRFEASVDDEPVADASARSAEEELETWSVDPVLRAALGALSPPARLSVLLAAVGYTGREIASAVGRTELASRALLCRARRSLRELLAGTELAGARDARRAAGPQLAA